jgi:hypothetical protein
MHWNDLTSLIPCDYKITRVDSPSRGQNASTTTARARRFTSTEVVYGLTGTEVTELPEYGVSP